MLRHHFSIKPGYQNIRMLSHKTWGCSYMQHGDVVHEYIPMFYIRTSGCFGNRSLIWGLHEVGLMVVDKYIEYLVKTIMIHSLN